MPTKKEAREAMAAKESQVVDLLLQGKTAAEIETALELWPGAVDTMRQRTDIRAALSERRAYRELARMDRLQAIGSKALDRLEAALTQDDVDPKLYLAVLQLVAKLPRAVWAGESETVEDMERNAARDRRMHF